MERWDDPQRSFSDGRAVARGINGAEGTRNAPALINRGYGRSFFWDGRAQSLEQQALQPITNPIELGLAESELERRMGMKAADVTGALASYVRTIRSGDSRFDRNAAGRTNALTPLEKTGLQIFRGKDWRASCHAGPSLTDEQFHNTAVAWRDGRLTDQGRFTVSGNERDRGAFKTPTLREIARTAPYMHDGRLANTRRGHRFLLKWWHSKQRTIRDKYLFKHERASEQNISASATSSAFIETV